MKRQIIAKLLLALVAMLFFVSAANPTIGFIVDSVDIDNFPEIKLRLTAWESTGAVLKSLKATDFQIQENQGEPFTPGSLEIDTDSPLAVALVLDVSGSMVGQALKDAQVAAARFLDRLSSNDQAALVAFSEGVNPDPGQLKADKEYGFTHELKVLYDAVEGLEAGGGTELYNALQKAIALTAQLPEGHRAILLLSDGVNDPANVGDPETPIQMAKELNVPIFTIGLGYHTDEDYLTRLANETGGLVRFAPRSSELAQTFKEIADMLKTQYILTYESQLTQAGAEVTANVSLVVDGVSNQRTVLLTGIDQKLNELQLRSSPDSPEQAPSGPAEALTPGPEQTAQAPSIEASEPDQSMPPNEEPAPTVSEFLREPWVWLGLVSLLAVFIFFLSKRKKTQPICTCARCGYKFSDNTSNCPQCGESRKI